MDRRVWFFVVPLLLSVACSQATSSSSDPPTVPDEAPADAGADAPAPVCAPPPGKTKCRTGGESAFVRGVARFDPSKRAPGSAAPTLSIFLRHSFVIGKAEAKVGGRLHAYERIPLDDAALSSGVVPFAIDLCEQDVAMWSEENGLFNLVVILDENGVHDVDEAESSKDALERQTPVTGELVHMVTGIDVSCHGESLCLDVPLDCQDGTSCTTITPISHVECRTPSCASDQEYCSGGATH